MMADLRSLYEEVILDHNRNPRNFQYAPPGANHVAHGYNPLCGDELTVSLRLENGIVTDIGFEGAGCAIATASASLMTESIKGKSVEEAKALFESVHEMLTQQGSCGDLGKLQVLGGVREYPARVKCATLAWHTLQAALRKEHGIVSTE